MKNSNIERADPATKLTAVSITGAVAAAFAASACCLGPLLFAALGIGGAGLLVKLEAYRTYFAASTLVLLGAGFYLTHRRPSPARATADGTPACVCERPAAGRLGRVALWIATVVVVTVLAFPYVAETLFG